MKIELIEGWHKWYKLWSVRLTALGTALAAIFLMIPDAAIQVWLVLPQEFKDAMPPYVVKVVPVVVLVSGIVARVVKQNKLPKVNTDESA